MKTHNVLIASLLCSLSSPAISEVTSWTLVETKFSDGGTISGSYSYNSIRKTCENVDLIVQGPLFEKSDSESFIVNDDTIKKQRLIGKCTDSYIDFTQPGDGAKYFRLTFNNKLDSSTKYSAVVQGAPQKPSYYGQGSFTRAKGSTSGFATPTPNKIDYTLYFDADIRDAEFCMPQYQNGKLINFGDNVTNPAMTCPDAFSWYLFTKVVKDQFWSDWSDELQNWPEKPWPLCTDQSGKNCCHTESNLLAKNNPDHCPTSPLITEQKLRLEAKSFLKSISTTTVAQKLKASKEFVKKFPKLAPVGAPNHHGRVNPLTFKDIKNVAECTTEQLNSILPTDVQSIGRVLRQTNSELTVRNQEFHNYLFKNNLYNAEGVLDVFQRNSRQQLLFAPLHSSNKSATQTTKANLSIIDFPPNAIMIKSNWISAELVEAIKKKYPESMTQFGDSNSYITQAMSTKINTPTQKNPECVLSGEHYLMAFHISSKDIPQWVWTTFEHKNNPGRCDYTGCNDSFGHLVKSGKIETNFIPPHQKNDGLSEDSPVFSRDKQYAHGSETSALTKLLMTSNIGTSTRMIETSDSIEKPSPQDPAWKNYRLKGSQIDFTDHQGRGTLLGNSITEAGFMSRSSCIGCHAKASVAPLPNQPNTATFVPLSVFESILSEFGYQQSHKGTPVHSWYYNDDNRQSLNVLQTDFIWGFLNAKPLIDTANQN